MRVPPLPADQWDDEKVQAVIRTACAPDRREPGESGNAIATLVQHPDLAGAYLPFSAYLLTESTLPPALRELAILRLAHRADCAYEWTHHVPMGRAVGLTDADIDAARGADAATDLHRLIIAAVDQLFDRTTISEQTWQALTGFLERRALMDLVFTVGGYLALAMGLNSFGVQPESAQWREDAHQARPAAEPGPA
ncbi:carboxymuconolactone decarboxylase [Mycolicibacterium duvalii]|uniref:Carboxymuconolactone decarboxylase n=1 Tax=Mycolicibacterium duvalii TaxID=39688 RepID=A0A7I7K071_9MYCO|nr:carboxymuconolactone decarboxylase family protein [Mycolicibacterium duvalii]MCV7369816.1 carboxymuconolactone decarboxylase family protein [Mycolicibacterium duvalii]PEG36999.1 carboxymuconolactone decarboxylase [Mycolicibacterium duvalii]BBX17546.1 carboxymuconolactone decarboxylase [Mycolicibacterium duvalii]